MVREVAQTISDLGHFARQPATLPAPIILSWVGGRTEDDDQARYAVQLAGQDQPVVISLGEGVWTPATYTALARASFPSSSATSGVTDSAVPNTQQDIVSALLAPSFPVLFAEDQRVSDLLTAQPSSASGHVQAALLLGTLAFNDHAGPFRDARRPINRFLAHLAIADAAGASTEEPARWLAEAMRLTLCGLQVRALEWLEKPPASEGELAVALREWSLILRLRNTGDWRDSRAAALAGGYGLRQEYFYALVRSINDANGVEFLSEAEAEKDIGYVRIANRHALSISNGHLFSRSALGLELGEASRAALAHGLKVGECDLAALAAYLDTAPTSPVEVTEGAPAIRVVGRGLFADHHQRHVLHAAAKMYSFLKDNWGVKDDAQKLETFLRQKLPPLALTPFMLRLISREPAEREAANVDCERFIAARPEFVTPALWMTLRDDHKGAQILPHPDHHNWFRPEVPRGTAFEVNERLHQIGLGDENDAAWMRAVWERAPYSVALAQYNAIEESGGYIDQLTPDAVRKWLDPMLGYNLRAMKLLARRYKSAPDLFREHFGRAAALDPELHLDLAEYLLEKNLRDEALVHYELGFEKSPDRVAVAHDALSFIRILVEQGNEARALVVAEEAADVYSYRGLFAHGWLMEHRADFPAALETARKIDARYNDDEPIAEIACLIRIAERAPELVAREGYKEKVSVLFPAGVRRVSLADFSGPPALGVIIREDNAKMVPFGLQAGMVIVALDGIRTDTLAQYTAVRDLTLDPEIRFNLLGWFRLPHKRGQD